MAPRHEREREPVLERSGFGYRLPWRRHFAEQADEQRVVDDGGASWGRVAQKTRGGNRNDPHILNYFDNDVLASADRPWSYRLSGVYELPYQVSFSGTWMYQAGAPEERRCRC
jgi:hypothetical protein